MSEAFLGEIRMFGFPFPPHNWAACLGQLMPIRQNTALFSIIGTMFGGNGTSIFALPNLSDNVVVGAGTAVTGTNYDVGEEGGESSVLLTNANSPAHTHTFGGLSFRNNADTNTPGPTLSYGNASGCKPYLAGTTSPAPSMAVMSPMALGPAGEASPTPHDNVMPNIAMNFCICINGMFPQRP